MFGRQEYREINGNLNRQLEEKQVLIAVHRGTWGGNVIQNTIQAYRIALDMGGDIFECDAALSADGVFYAFHDGTEPINLGREENLTTLPSQEIDRLVCINSAYGPSGVHVEKLEDVLQAFTHGELFNIDRAWEHLPQLDALLARYPPRFGPGPCQNAGAGGVFGVFPPLSPEIHVHGHCPHRGGSAAGAGVPRRQPGGHGVPSIHPPGPAVPG